MRLFKRKEKPNEENKQYYNIQLVADDYFVASVFHLTQKEYELIHHVFETLKIPTSEDTPIFGVIECCEDKSDDEIIDRLLEALKQKE